MRLRLTLLFLALVAAAAAKDAKVTLRSLELVADADANRSTATAVDILYVHAPAALAVLPKSSAEWFAKKSTLASQLGTSLDLVSLQVPPGVTVPSLFAPPRARDALAVLVYAGYVDNSKVGPVNVSRLRHAVVHLRASTVEAAERAKPARPH